jgi:hypothetical protein
MEPHLESPRVCRIAVHGFEFEDRGGLLAAVLQSTV